MGSFCWLSPRPLDRETDLRRRGWRRLPFPPRGIVRESTLLLVDHAACRKALRRCPRLDLPDLPFLPAQTMLLGVAGTRCRALLLERGYGEALPPGIALEELAIRARRVMERLVQVPCYRDIGPLRLDLFHRDGFVGESALTLHPREFAMLWHLAGLGGRGASRSALLREVWGIAHEPETNSVAVHAFRIRAKLRVHGLDAMLWTDRAGRYRLSQREARRPEAHRPETRRLDTHALDAPPPMREKAGKEIAGDQTVL